MQRFKVVDDPTNGAITQLPTNQFLNKTHYALILARAHQQIPQILENKYCWYSMDNRQAALEHKDAINLALQHQLSIQVQVHLDKLVYLVTKDMAECSFHLAMKRLGYRGSLKCEYYRNAGRLDFVVPIATNLWGTKRTDWVFKPIQNFAKEIPLHALRAMHLLDDEGIRPDAYWVADKIETKIERNPIFDFNLGLSVDPILCARFGQWFASIAMWL